MYNGLKEWKSRNFDGSETDDIIKELFECFLEKYHEKLEEKKAR